MFFIKLLAIYGMIKLFQAKKIKYYVKFSII